MAGASWAREATAVGDLKETVRAGILMATPRERHASPRIRHPGPAGPHDRAAHPGLRRRGASHSRAPACPSAPPQRGHRARGTAQGVRRLVLARVAAGATRLADRAAGTRRED